MSVQDYTLAKKHVDWLVGTNHMRALGDLAAGRVTCGGTLDTPIEVRVNYLNKTESWTQATFPGLEEADFQQLLEHRSFRQGLLSSHRGDESIMSNFPIRGFPPVTDNSYCLDSKNIFTSFQLSDTSILKEVRLLLTPGIRFFRAKLQQMNIYTASTGGVKAHVPRPVKSHAKLLGTIIVCLPTQFVGGALVTRHNGQQVTYDWSSPAGEPAQKIQWAAVTSDVEHEILPVTKGYRVTLTYIISEDSWFPSYSEVDTCPIYMYLKAVLGHPHFLRDGGTLGFACQHQYVLKDLKASYDMKEPDLSPLVGSDLMVVLVAKSLRLKVRVEFVIVGVVTPDSGPQQQHLTQRFICNFSETLEVNEGQQWEDYFKRKRDDSYITWCQEEFQQRQPAITGYYDEGDEDEGDEESLEMNTYYKAPAILVCIPEWNKRD